MVEEEMWESLERAFQVYGEPVDTVASFKFMGRVLTEGMTTGRQCQAT